MSQLLLINLVAESLPILGDVLSRCCGSDIAIARLLGGHGSPRGEGCASSAWGLGRPYQIKVWIITAEQFRNFGFARPWRSHCAQFSFIWHFLVIGCETLLSFPSASRPIYSLHFAVDGWRKRGKATLRWSLRWRTLRKPAPFTEIATVDGWRATDPYVLWCPETAPSPVHNFGIFSTLQQIWNKQINNNNNNLLNFAANLKQTKN